MMVSQKVWRWVCLECGEVRDREDEVQHCTEPYECPRSAENDGWACRDLVCEECHGRVRRWKVER